MQWSALGLMSEVFHTFQRAALRETGRSRQEHSQHPGNPLHEFSPLNASGYGKVAAQVIKGASKSYQKAGIPVVSARIRESLALELSCCKGIVRVHEAKPPFFVCGDTVRGPWPW